MFNSFLLVKWYVKEPIIFQINTNSRYYLSPKSKYNNTLLSLRTIINYSANMIYHDSRDVVPYSLISISHNDFSSLTHLHVPMEEHYNITDEKIEEKTLNMKA